LFLVCCCCCCCCCPLVEAKRFYLLSYEGSTHVFCLFSVLEVF
jgi:hypothetical protein